MWSIRRYHWPDLRPLPPHHASMAISTVASTSTGACAKARDAIIKGTGWEIFFSSIGEQLSLSN